MPRRRPAIDYDEDDLFDDDGYNDEVEQDEEQGTNTRSRAEDPDNPEVQLTNVDRGDADASSALDDLVSEFRSLLGNSHIPREQIDAVLIAAEYDVEEAARILERSVAETSSETARALESSKPSAIARMMDADQDQLDPNVSLLPAFAPPGLGKLRTTAFQSPSPDEIIQQRQAAGRNRASLASSAKEQTAQAKAPVASASGLPNSRTPLAKSVDVDAGNFLEPAETERKRWSATGKSRAKTGNAVRNDGEAGPQIRQRDNPSNVPSASVIAKEAPSVAVVVAGHVDAGKSTLVGHLLRLVGAVCVESPRHSGSHKQRARGTSKSSMGDELAWTTDEDLVEQERGITIDIATRVFRSRSSKKIFCLIDSPGHRDFVPAMILGAFQASAAILIVDASFGEFESGFSSDGQTREHALLLRALGVSRLVVVVNKMDMVSFSQTRYAEIEAQVRVFLNSTGWKVESDVAFVPASGLSGVNLVESSAKDHMLGSWYGGYTLLDALESIPPSDEETIAAAMARPTRMLVSDVFRSSSLGGILAVCGRLLCGTIAVKDRLLVSPSSEIAQVKAIQLGLNSKLQDGRPVIAGADNLPISLGLTDIPDTILISPGDVLCDPAFSVPVVSRFRARVLVLDTPVPVVQGTQVELHLGGVYEAAWISKLNELVGGKSPSKSPGSGNDSAKKLRPRRLVKGNSAIVEISVSRKICVEIGTEVRFLGRFALRCQGRTVAAGIVTVLLGDKRESSSQRLGPQECEHGL